MRSLERQLKSQLVYKRTSNPRLSAEATVNVHAWAKLSEVFAAAGKVDDVWGICYFCDKRRPR